MKKQDHTALLNFIAVAWISTCAFRAFAGEKAAPPKYTQAKIRQLCHELSSNDDQVRWRAAEELMKAGPQSTDMLCGILQGEWLEGRKLAAYVLGEIKDPTAVLPLASCLGDEDFHVRWKCAVALKNIGGPSGRALAQVLRTGNLKAQYAAAWALGEIKDPRATLALAETATANDHHLRWKSVISLKRIGPPAVEELGKLLKAERVTARRCAVWALDQLGGSAAAELLLGSVADGDEDVRRRVAEALSKYDRPDVRAALEKLVDDQSPSVRRQAVMSIARLGQDIAAKANGGIGDDHVPKWRMYEVIHTPVGELRPQAEMIVRFLTPSQGSQTVRGFRATDGSWRARIAPGEVGEWFYKLTFTSGGKTTVEHGMFSCDDSDLPGTLILPKVPRPHLEAGGRPIHLVEAPLPGALPASFRAWKLLLDACGKHGFNLLRLDLTRLFDRADRPETELLLDDVLAYGHQVGVYFVLTLFDETHVLDEGLWARSPFNAANGGPIRTEERFPVFYDPVSPEIGAMQGDYIRRILARAGGHPNVIFELCRGFNANDAAVPFAKSWLRRRLALFEDCPRPVMLSAAEGAEGLCTVAGIDVAGIHSGHAPEDRLPALLIECPADPIDAISEAWLAMVGGGALVSWAGTPVENFEESIRFVTEAEDRARVLIEFASVRGLYELKPDPAIVLSSPPGIRVAARAAKKRAVVAVARKLAVLLHRLWVTAEVYEPLRNPADKLESIAQAVPA